MPARADRRFKRPIEVRYDRAQAERLAELGCGYGQGYRLAKPASRAEMRELLRSRTTW